MNSHATILHGERGPPPHFAGREAELSLLRQRLDLVLSSRDAAVDGMLLITGVPGIGKTHLLDHFTRQAAESENVAAITVSPVDLTSPEGLLLEIGEALGERDQFAKAAGIDDKISGVRAGVGGVVSGGVTLDSHRPELGFSHMLRATEDSKAWRGRALIVVIDEVQSADARSADQLQTLHLGQHGCPILTIAAGLQHSKSVLSDCGVSRTSHRRLGLLSVAETVEAVYRGLTNLGIDVTEDTAKKIADASMRFPQHVHGHLEAARDVHEERGDINAPDAVAAVLEAGRSSREDYYLGRLGAMGRADRLYPLVERMADDEVDAVTFAKAEATIGIDAVNAAVQHGVLAEQEDGVLSFDIPSFRGYMVERALKHRARFADGPR